MPFWFIEWIIKRQVARVSSAQLWASLRRGDGSMPNFMLRELRHRGEDSSEVLHFTLEMLLKSARLN